MVQDKAQTGRGQGTDENIKSDSYKNDPNDATPAPPSKGGEKTRGAYCAIVFDNYTPWYIKCYVDGSFRGVVGPYSDLSLSFICGETRVYARADFEGGGYRYWGPRIFYASSGAYRWRLGK
jgi:hypothetical protein